MKENSASADFSIFRLCVSLGFFARRGCPEDRPGSTLPKRGLFKNWVILPVNPEISHPIGAIRAHFKPLKPVILLRNPRNSGFFKKPVLNSRFLALNSPLMRSVLAYFVNRGLFWACFSSAFSCPHVFLPTPQKQYPVCEGFLRFRDFGSYRRRSAIQ